MSVLIKNAVQTSSSLPPSPYKTWLEFWESRMGKIDENKEFYCLAEDCRKSCFRKELDGCHVQKVFDVTKKMYIIPLCSGCNHRNDFFNVNEDWLVPVP